MLADQPSHTQLRTALRRATHQLFDVPLILHDPIALRVVPEAAALDTIAQLQSDGSPDLGLLRTLFAIRSRFAEDRLAEAAQRGVSQYVVLGAGLDTFPWRQPRFAEHMRIFMADHPSSLPFAQERFRAAGLLVPDNTKYVPIDLEQNDLLEALGRHSFDPTRPAFISLLGVSQYISVQSIERLIRFAAGLRPSSELVVSVALPENELEGVDLEASRRSSTFTASIGEPWITRLSPRELQSKLQKAGFRSVFTLTPQAAKERYLPFNALVPTWEQVLAGIL